jgi:hypothetical protein
MDYKVGDQILVKLTITETTSDSFKATAGVADEWFLPYPSIVALVERAVEEQPPAPEPTPEPKIKVGDRVKLTHFDKQGVVIYNDGHEFFPFHVRLDSGDAHWYSESALELTPETPAPEPRRFQVGDKVLVRGDRCTIVKDDHSHTYPFKVKWDDGSEGDEWCAPEELTLIEEPAALRFKVGDKVIHKFRPDWGVGTVSRVLADHIDCDVEEFMQDHLADTRSREAPYAVKYSHPSYCFSENWWTAEEHLIAAE